MVQHFLLPLMMTLLAKQSAKPIEPIDLIGGHPALDLINSLDFRFSPQGPQERLSAYNDLLRFTHQSGLLSESRARKLKRAGFTAADRASVLHQAHDLRETLASAAYSLLDQGQLPPAALPLLEPYFKQAAAQRRLIIDGSHLIWEWKGLGRRVEAPLWLLAHAAAELFTSPALVRLRACADPACRWLFLDTSKNHTRRWCDMRICGNRNKARNFQARQSPPQSPAP